MIDRPLPLSRTARTSLQSTSWLILILGAIGFYSPVLGQIAPIVPRQPIRFPLPPQPPTPVPIPETLPTVPFDYELPSVPSFDERINIPGTITVKRFEFLGNTAFSQRQLARVTAPFLDRPITFAELLQAEAAITKLYTDAGYINSGAVIPAGQSFAREEAVIQIQIVEGGIEDIRVSVEGRLNPGYIKSRLAEATSTPLNQNRLLEALQLLQLNPLVERISADLSAGSRADLNILTVRVEEADTLSGEVFLNNSRVQSIGSFERGVTLTENNLTGNGDSLSFEYANTDGSNSYYARYAIPINPQNGTLEVSAQYSNSWVIESPFNRFNITGYALYYDLTYRQPLIQTPTQEVALGITLGREEIKNNVLGVGFPLSPGADDDGRTNVSVIRFFQEWTQRSNNDVLALRSQFNYGIDAFDATIQNTPPDGRFFDWLGQLQYVRLLTRDTLLVLRSSLQLATDPLVPIEQFSLGGLYSVRGYRQDLLLTDNGLFSSAEVRLPLLRIDEVKGLLQIIPFVDFGVGWNNFRNPIPTPRNNTLMSVGLGLQYQMNDKFNARVDWGIPLIDFRLPGNNSPEQSIYFTVNYRFF